MKHLFKLLSAFVVLSTSPLLVSAGGKGSSSSSSSSDEDHKVPDDDTNRVPQCDRDTYFSLDLDASVFGSFWRLTDTETGALELIGDNEKPDDFREPAGSILGPQVTPGVGKFLCSGRCYRLRIRNTQENRCPYRYFVDGSRKGRGGTSRCNVDIIICIDDARRTPRPTRRPTREPTWRPPPTKECFVEVKFLTDTYPTENSWQVERIRNNGQKELQFAGSGFNQQFRWYNSGQKLEPGRYRFTIFDKAQDGLSGGEYRVELNGKTVGDGRGDFGAEESVNFRCEDSSSINRNDDSWPTDDGWPTDGPFNCGSSNKKVNCRCCKDECWYKFEGNHERIRTCNNDVCKNYYGTDTCQDN